MDSEVIDVIILSKSSKHHKYCVAGIDVSTGSFVRLNSEDEVAHGALCEQDMIYENGLKCLVLDIARVIIKRHAPLKTQPENKIIDSRFNWEKLGECNILEIDQYVSKHINGLVFGSNSYIISEDQAVACRRSLELVRATDLHIYRSPNLTGQLKSRIDFKVNNRDHKAYYMTDPELYKVQDGTKIKESLLLVSIPDGAPFFKFVSKILTMA